MASAAALTSSARAGSIAREVVIQAVIERNRSGPKAEQIREILGKALAGGVAAEWLFSYSKPLISAIGSEAIQLTLLHIV